MPNDYDMLKLWGLRFASAQISRELLTLPVVMRRG
jgi:hypothetical protein